MDYAAMQYWLMNNLSGVGAAASSNQNTIIETLSQDPRKDGRIPLLEKCLIKHMVSKNRSAP